MLVALLLSVDFTGLLYRSEQNGALRVYHYYYGSIKPSALLCPLHAQYLQIEESRPELPEIYVSSRVCPKVV